MEATPSSRSSLLAVCYRTHFIFHATLTLSHTIRHHFSLYDFSMIFLNCCSLSLPWQRTTFGRRRRRRADAWMDEGGGGGKKSRLYFISLCQRIIMFNPLSIQENKTRGIVRE